MASGSKWAAMAAVAATAWLLAAETHATTTAAEHVAAVLSGEDGGDVYAPPSSPTLFWLGNTTSPEEDQPSYYTYVGAIISIMGNLCISAGLNVQKYVHMKIADAELGAHDGVISTNYAQHRVWWLGMVLMALGEMGNFGAYFFAPASLVAPLGTVTVVANALIAPLCLGEAFRRRDGVGVLFAVSGAVLIVIGAPDTEDALDTDLLYRHLQHPVFLSYICTITAIALGCYVALRFYSYGEKYIVIPLFITATLGSYTILSVKSLSMLLRETFAGNNQFVAPLVYFVILILVGTAVTQVKFLNYAMAHFDSTEVVPTFFVMFTIAAIMVGAIFFEDFNDVSDEKRGIFSAGIICCFFGVYLITSQRPKDEADIAVTYSPDRPESVGFKPAESTSRGDRSYLLLPEELYTRDRSDSGHSITALNPLLGVETTPLLKTHRRMRTRLSVNHSGGSSGSDSTLVEAGTGTRLVSPLLEPKPSHAHGH